MNEDDRRHDVVEKKLIDKSNHHWLVVTQTVLQIHRHTDGGEEEIRSRRIGI